MHPLRIDSTLAAVDAAAWNGLLHQQATPTPFMQHAYLNALEATGCAAPSTSWKPYYFSLWSGSALQAACALYVKDHSYGEYVFDWAWANAYHQHGLPYYPKAVLAVPFTPVPGSRLLACSPALREELLFQVQGWGAPPDTGFRPCTCCSPTRMTWQLPMHWAGWSGTRCNSIGTTPQRATATSTNFWEC